MPEKVEEIYQPNNQQKAKIERGNTVAGVNETIIKLLVSLDTDFANQNLLDVPCGEGEFIRALKNYFPLARVAGADLKPPRENSGDFFSIDARRSFEFPAEKKFSVITCISGVMEFDNTLSFFEQLKNSLSEQGLLIVTNDNLLTVRDRLLYLFFGRTRQYKSFIGLSQPTWKQLSLQNLRRILWEADCEVREIHYAPVSHKEWIWLPLALPLYFLQRLYLKTSEKSSELNETLPLASLLSRHYVLVCQPVCRGEKPVI